jgi:hypothetical protein
MVIFHTKIIWRTGRINDVLDLLRRRAKDRKLQHKYCRRSMRHFRILHARSLTGIKFHTQDPKNVMCPCRNFMALKTWQRPFKWNQIRSRAYLWHNPAVRAIICGCPEPIVFCTLMCVLSCTAVPLGP